MKTPRPIFLALGLFAFVAAAWAADAPKKNDDPLVGIWRGFHTVGGMGYQHRIEVRKQGSTYAGVGILWSGLSEEQAIGAARGIKPAGEIPARALCVQQTYAVMKDGDKLTFAGTNAAGLFKSTKYNCDIFSGKLDPAGAFAGEAADSKKKEGTFQLANEQLLKTPLPLQIEKGKTVDMSCVDGGNYHYKVYLPKSYDPGKSWPLLVNFSPGGNADPLNTDAAEEAGWIMAGLTESKNGPYGPICENRDAALFDCWRRFNVDWKRVYFSGFSGGARASATTCCVYPGMCAGLILIGAANGEGNPPKNVPIFYIAGKTDMNLAEVKAAYDGSKRAGRKTDFIEHPGGHEWGRAEDHKAAIKWLQQQFDAGAKKPDPAKK